MSLEVQLKWLSSPLCVEKDSSKCTNLKSFCRAHDETISISQYMSHSSLNFKNCVVGASKGEIWRGKLSSRTANEETLLSENSRVVFTTFSIRNNCRLTPSVFNTLVKVREFFFFIFECLVYFKFSFYYFAYRILD